MTIDIDGLGDAIAVAEIAAWIGAAAFTLMAVFFLYLLVRPARRKPPLEAEPDAIDPAEIRALVDRMEERMESLERIVSSERGRPTRLPGEKQELQNAGGAPEIRRMK